MALELAPPLKTSNHPLWHSSRSHDAVIRVYDNAGNVIETHDQGRRKSLPVS
jgi:YD repeat-containing protein